MIRCVLILLSLITTTSLAGEIVKEKDKLATLVPVVESLTKTLTKNIPVEVDYLPPKRLPVKRIKSWVAKNSSSNKAVADVLVGIDSQWPELAFYKAMRLNNISVIPVDVAKALIPSGESVATVQDGLRSYFWLSLNNTLVMNGILSRDMMRIWPEHASQIKQNSHQLARALRMMSVTLDECLMDKQVDQLVLDANSYADFAAGLNLPVVTLAEAKENQLNTLFVHKKGKSLPAMPKHVKSWPIDDFSKLAKTDFMTRWNANLTSLSCQH